MNEVLGSVQTTSVDQLSDIHTRSQYAFSLWAKISVQQRVAYLARFLEVYGQHRDVLASFISKEIGKAITHSYADIDYDIGYIQRHLDHTEEILSSEIIYQDTGSTHTVYYEPRGVAVVISPWNYPTSQFIWQVVPPLLAGNTVIYKPASACMRTGKFLVDMIINILPPDVLIPVYGNSDIGNELTKLPVAMIIFTGSTQVGQIIANNAASNLVHLHFELGGSAPAIILPGTRIDDAMMQYIDYLRVRHAGQICDGMKRFFVHISQYDTFIDAIIQYFCDISIGNPLDSQTRMGSLINSLAKDHILMIINQAQQQGARLHQLGRWDGTPGAFVPVSLLTHVTTNMQVMQEEVFGPVIPVMLYENLDEVITLANATKYGLGAYVWGDAQDEIDYVCTQLKTGNISVNNTSYLIPQIPFGGYTRASGNVREHGIVGLRSYTQMKVVSR